MAKKSTRAKAQDHQEVKPPSIEDAREALLLAVACWLNYLDDQPVTTHSKTLDAFFKHANVLHNLNRFWSQLLFADDQPGQWRDTPKRAFDSVLDMQSGFHEETAIEIICELSHTIMKVGSKAKNREAVLEAITREGLPSKRIEAKALLSKISVAMQDPGSNEKHPGLKKRYLELRDKGHSWTEIATLYVDGHHGCGVKNRDRLIGTVTAYLKRKANALKEWPSKPNPN
jgi:hypothetical protein